MDHQSRQPGWSRPHSHIRQCHFITGGAGFIGANLVRHILAMRPDAEVLVYDALTYAGHLENLTEALDSGRCAFVRGDICDRVALRRALDEHQPSIIYNLAAESHVDRSIDAPGQFVQTNVVGTFELLEATRAYRARLPSKQAAALVLVHVSTDEVFGSLGPEGRFSETSRYAPNSPYAASKASADHLVRAYHGTYGLGVVTTNCSNNYGPYQFPEKLLPLVLMNALQGKALPVYGDGSHIRDWLHVSDHCAALLLVAERGRRGHSYNIGANEEHTTLQMVHAICDGLEKLRPHKGQRYHDLIEFVPDRPGHDRRYAIDAGKIRSELGWSPRMRFQEGVDATVKWYLDNRAWCERMLERGKAGERLGLGA